MTDWLTAFFSVQLGFCTLWLATWMFRYYPWQGNRSQLLWIVYGFSMLVLAAPFFSNWASYENPFGVTLRPDSEELLGARTVLSFHRQGATPEQVGSSSIPDSLSNLFWFLVWGLGSLLHASRWCFAVFKIRAWISSGLRFKNIKKIRVYSSPLVKSPLSIWLGRSYIFMPDPTLQKPETSKRLLRHEFFHIKGRDTLVAHYLQLLKTLFWFNPFVFLWIREVETLQEQRVDAQVVGKRKNQTKAYLQDLLSFVHQSHFELPAGATGVRGNFYQLKRRIEMLVRPQQLILFKRKWHGILMGCLMVISPALLLGGQDAGRELNLVEAKKLASSLEGEIPIRVDSQVVYWLNKILTSQSRREGIRRALDRMEQLRPMLEQKLLDAALPLDLMAVPLIESAYINGATSSAGAAGIWQFMPGTARRCGLRVDEHVDERRDPAKLTDAAVCYYTILKAIFGDWHIALVAYNQGESNMVRILSEARHRDVLRMGREGVIRVGKSYLPKLMAALLILKNPDLVD